jgi:hypothetical protein
VRELPGSEDLASELPGDTQRRSFQPTSGARDRAELPARRTGFSEIAMLASKVIRPKQERPSPASSVGHIGTHLTVSAMDSSSEGPSPDSPFNSDAFGSPSASRQSSISPCIQSHEVSQPNSVHHSRSASKGASKSATASRSESKNVSRKGSTSGAAHAAGGQSGDRAAAVPDTKNSWSRWRSLARNSQEESSGNLAPVPSRDRNHAHLRPAAAEDGGLFRPTMFGSDPSGGMDLPDYATAADPVELPASPNALGRVKLRPDDFRRDRGWNRNQV